MRTERIWGFILIVFLASAALTAGSAFAQEKYPSKPITFIVPWSAGAGHDMVARTMQPYLEKNLGQSVIVINKPGGGGSIGFNEIANSPPDGYTIGQASPSLIMNQYTLKANVELAKLEPIMFGGQAPHSIMVRSDARWKTFKEILDYSKEHPGKLKMGNSGFGGNGHVGALFFEHESGVKWIHVPYKGNAPSFPALLGGHIDAIYCTITDAFPLVKGKKFRVLGIAASERCNFIPEVPTFKEFGINVVSGSFYLWLGPRGIAKDRVKILAEAFKRGVNSKEFKIICDNEGITITIREGEELVKFLAQEDKRWREVIISAGIKPE